jgi:hypothetical protein
MGVQFVIGIALREHIMSHLYDVHTHVGLDQGFRLRGWWPYAATAQDLLQLMDANHIDRAVTFGFTLPSAFDPYAFADRKTAELLPGRVPFDRENTLLLDEVDRIDVDKRLIPFAMFDPTRQVPAQVQQLEPLAGRIAGLKTQTTILESPIRGLLEEGRPLMDYARHHDLPVLLHTTVQPGAVHAQAADCLAVAEAYPEIRFNLAHSLGFHEKLLQVASAMSNVWIDCSALLVACRLAQEDHPIVAARKDRVDLDYGRPLDVLGGIYDIVGERYLWGSDNPYMSWCDDELRAIYSYRQEADVLHALPERIRLSMAGMAPEAWLYGKDGDVT